MQESNGRTALEKLLQDCYRSQSYQSRNYGHESRLTASDIPSRGNKGNVIGEYPTILPTS